MLECKECGETKPRDLFYRSNSHSCKECVKERVRSNRRENVAYYRSYDRMRYRHDDRRKEASVKSSKSDAGKECRKRYVKRVRTETPEKYKARNAVSNAIRDGKMQKGKECYFCYAETNLQAHHQDYSRPLDVFWLCPACHGKLHAINGDFLRSEAAA